MVEPPRVQPRLRFLRRFLESNAYLIDPLLGTETVGDGVGAELADTEGEMRRLADYCEIEVPEDAWPAILDAVQLDSMRADASRTTYLFDVRLREAYRAGHLPGSLSAPGGQLVQATDRPDLADWSIIPSADGRFVYFTAGIYALLALATWAIRRFARRGPAPSRRSWSRTATGTGWLLPWGCGAATSWPPARAAAATTRARSGR